MASVNHGSVFLSVPQFISILPFPLQQDVRSSTWLFINMARLNLFNCVLLSHHRDIASLFLRVSLQSNYF